jgi:hypothetical protein
LTFPGKLDDPPTWAHPEGSSIRDKQPIAPNPFPAIKTNKELIVKPLVLNVLLCFACAVLMAAQKSNSNSQSQTTNPNVQTVRGCLTMTGHSYVLLGGTPLRQYRVIGGDLAALKGKEEQTVEITGPVAEKQSGAGVHGMYGPGSTTGVGYDTIKAQSVRDVYGNCG